MKELNETAGQGTTDIVLDEIHSHIATITAQSQVFYSRKYGAHGDEWVAAHPGADAEAREFFQQLANSIKS